MRQVKCKNWPERPVIRVFRDDLAEAISHDFTPFQMRKSESRIKLSLDGIIQTAAVINDLNVISLYTFFTLTIYFCIGCLIFHFVYIVSQDQGLTRLINDLWESFRPKNCQPRTKRGKVWTILGIMITVLFIILFTYFIRLNTH